MKPLSAALPPTTTPDKMPKTHTKPFEVNVFEAYMIENLKNNSSTAFIHTVTADFHMSAGVAII